MPGLLPLCVAAFASLYLSLWAAGSRVFPRAYDANSLCTPSLASSLRYRWLVAGPLQLIVSSGINGATEPPRLFYLKADPAELHDLATARPDDVKRLTALRDGWWNGR